MISTPYPLNGMFSGKMKTNRQLWRRPILRQIDVNGCLPAVVAHIFISRLCAYEQTFKSRRCSRCRLAVYLHLSTVLSEQNLAQNLRNGNNHPTVPTWPEVFQLAHRDGMRWPCLSVSDVAKHAVSGWIFWFIIIFPLNMLCWWYAKNNQVTQPA